MRKYAANQMLKDKNNLMRFGIKIFDFCRDITKPINYKNHIF